MHRMRLVLLGFLFLLISFSKLACAQAVDHDLSFWNWYQVEYNFNKHHYVNVQFQYRLNHQFHDFDKSNLYFTYGRNIGKNWNAECLYQFTTNYDLDSHTLYAGITYRLKLGSCKLYYRMSAQHIRNYFTGEYATDQPYTEFRNRLRLVVPISKSVDMGISTEPYIKFSSIRAAYCSRMRSVLQFNYALNNYQSVTAFLMYEPSVTTFAQRHTDEVIGLTWQLSIPKKFRHLKRLYKMSSGKKKKDKDNFQ